MSLSFSFEWGEPESLMLCLIDRLDGASLGLLIVRHVHAYMFLEKLG